MIRGPCGGLISFYLLPLPPSLLKVVFTVSLLQVLTRKQNLNNSEIQ